MADALRVEHLTVTVDGKEVVRDVSLALARGAVGALMGPNGAGKSSLANALMGHPRYTLTAGQIFLNDEDVTALPPHEKARRGLFLSPQYPPAIAGVTIAGFLRAAVSALRGAPPSIRDFRLLLEDKARLLGLEPSFLDRPLHDGLSGGEKKRAEALQLLVLEPTVAILDETDSGLDVDALKIVADAIERFRAPNRAILLITHYQRMLEFVRPDAVHVMVGGRIIRSNGPALADEIHRDGYASFMLS